MKMSHLLPAATLNALLARRLASHVAEGKILARPGRDELAILGVTSEDVVAHAALAGRIRQAAQRALVHRLGDLRVEKGRGVIVEIDRRHANGIKRTKRLRRCFYDRTKSTSRISSRCSLPTELLVRPNDSNK